MIGSISRSMEEAAKDPEWPGPQKPFKQMKLSFPTVPKAVPAPAPPVAPVVEAPPSRPKRARRPKGAYTE